MNIIARFSAGALFVFFVALIAWCFGVNIETLERGPGLGFYAIAILIAAAGGFSCPVFDKR